MNPKGILNVNARFALNIDSSFGENLVSTETSDTSGSPAARKPEDTPRALTPITSNIRFKLRNEP